MTSGVKNRKKQREGSSVARKDLDPLERVTDIPGKDVVDDVVAPSSSRRRHSERRRSGVIIGST